MLGGIGEKTTLELACWLANFLGKLRDRAEHLKVIQHPVSRCEKGLDSGLYSRVYGRKRSQGHANWHRCKEDRSQR